MSGARIRERENRTHTRSQLSTIDQDGDLRQVLAGDVHEKERGFDPVALREALIRLGYGRNQLAASAEDLERPLLRIAAD
jgi:hypothetical protein